MTLDIAGNNLELDRNCKSDIQILSKLDLKIDNKNTCSVCHKWRKSQQRSTIVLQVYLSRITWVYEVNQRAAVVIVF